MKIKALPFFLSSLFFLLLAGTIKAQEIQVVPQKGWQGALMDVGISGTNTQFISATSTCGTIDLDKIMFHQGMSSFAPISLNLESDVQLYTQIDIPVNAPTGLYDVILWPGQASCTINCQDCFEVFPPSQITSVSPDEDNINTTNLDVTITADYTCFTQGSSTCQANPSNVRFFQPSPGTFSFNPNSVTIIDDKSLIANIDLPSFAIVGDYNVVVAEGFPCEASCDTCFTILGSPFLELITGNQGTQGQDTTIVLEVFFADIAACGYTPVTVFLQLGNYTITPDNVSINGQLINMEVTVPDDAPIGDYDIVVGNGLGEPCEYICSGCFTVDYNVGTTTPIFENSLIVYPNPNDGSFTIASESMLFDCCLEIYDAAGKLVVSDRMEKMKNYPVTLDSKGVYLLKVATKEAVNIQRIVVVE